MLALDGLLFIGHFYYSSLYLVNQDLERLVLAQQIFVLMKTSSRRLYQDEYVHLSLTSFKDVFKTLWRRLGQDQYIRLGHMSSRRLQDVLKTSLKRLQGVFKTSSRRLQDIFKTSCKDIFKTFSKRSIRLNCLPRSMICIGHISEKFMVIVENL